MVPRYEIIDKMDILLRKREYELYYEYVNECDIYVMFRQVGRKRGLFGLAENLNGKMS